MPLNAGHAGFPPRPRQSMTKRASSGVLVSIVVFQWMSTLRSASPAASAVSTCRLSSWPSFGSSQPCGKRVPSDGSAAATCAPESLTKPFWKSSEGAFARKRRSNSGASARSPACQTTSVPLRWKNTGSGISAIKPGQRSSDAAPSSVISNSALAASASGASIASATHAADCVPAASPRSYSATRCHAPANSQATNRPHKPPPTTAKSSRQDARDWVECTTVFTMTTSPQQTLQNARSTARISRSGEMPVSNPGCTRGAQNIFQGRNHGEKAAWERNECGSCASQYWKKLETRRFPETSLAGITRIGCKGTLSASPRVSPSFPRRETRAEAPLFRHRSLKHKSETTRKRGGPLRAACVGRPALRKSPGARRGQDPTAFPFVRGARTLAQCRERQVRLPRTHTASAWLLHCIGGAVVSRARIKEQLSHARNNAPTRAVFNGLLRSLRRSRTLRIDTAKSQPAAEPARLQEAHDHHTSRQHRTKRRQSVSVESYQALLGIGRTRHCMAFADRDHRDQHDGRVHQRPPEHMERGLLQHAASQAGRRLSALAADLRGPRVRVHPAGRVWPVPAANARLPVAPMAHAPIPPGMARR